MTQAALSKAYLAVSTCDLADALPREQFLDYQIKPLWDNMPRIAGPAFTVHCEPGDHLMLHAAIYAAQPGDIIVALGDTRYALSGGNVCAIAQQNGIAGFVIDGVVRDLAEVRDMQFPVHALGVHPKPGAKKIYRELNQPVKVGGVLVHAGDMVVADEDGVAIIPQAEIDSALAIAQQRHAKDAGQTLAEWRANHEKNVHKILSQLRN